MPPTWLIGALFPILIATWWLLKIGRRPAGYPPGPPTVPILGNLHQIPLENKHLQFQKWAQKYGPIYSVIMGCRTVIVLSSDEIVKELLDKRGSIYSSRPDSYIATLSSDGMHVGTMQYNDTWRMCSKLYTNSLTTRASKSYRPYQDLENMQMLNDLLERPTEFYEHFRRYSYSVTAQMVFGFRIPDNDDPNLLEIYDGWIRWSTLMGTSIAALVDMYPWMRHLPDLLLPKRRYAKGLHEKQLALFSGYWTNVKEKISSNTALPCFAHDMFKEQKAKDVSDDFASYICGVLLQGGSDTTAAEFVGFVQAMVLYPEVQKRAQAEVDEVCAGRLPTLEDMQLLPYVRACVKEVCRWMFVPTPILGLPHSVIRDDEYMGYRIPKGATVLCNVWSIHMDPARHANPKTFDPSRYLHDHRSAKESALCPNAKERDHFIYGAGRRVCKGIDVAEASLHLGVARMLWAFNISKAKDKWGNDITPNPKELEGELGVTPKPFPAQIIPRSEKHAQIVKSEWVLAKSHLSNEDQQWNEADLRQKLTDCP